MELGERTTLPHTFGIDTMPSLVRADMDIDMDLDLGADPELSALEAEALAMVSQLTSPSTPPLAPASTRRGQRQQPSSTLLSGPS